jgi:predicted RNA-binding Zn-ribbon protein involved in translation (DUF1610 family)
VAVEFHCPKCGADITDSHIDDDPSVGITGGYYCDECQEGYPSPVEDDYAEYESERRDR